MHHWKGLDLEITVDSEVITIPSQTSNLEQIEVINVSDKPTYGTSLETS